MNDEFKDVIEEKFTRCPNCRSFSVQQTEDLTFDERFKARFVTAIAFKCNNCSYRYVEFGRFSDSLKNFLHSLVECVKPRWLLAAVPAGIVVIITAVIWLTTGHTAPVKPLKPIDERPTVTSNSNLPPTGDTGQKEVKEPPNETTLPVETSSTTEPVTETKPIATLIILGNNNRFGVNWITVEKGVQISRISPGPLKEAGFQLGDIVSEIDGQKIENQSVLLKTRNDIFSGKQQEALLKVLRDDEVLYFRMQKNKIIPDKKESSSQNSSAPLKPNTASLIPPTVKPDEKAASVQQTGSMRVFSGVILKIRSSAPDSVDKSNKWGFIKNSITIRREANQRVFIAGDPAGIRKWGVDDMLVINGVEYSGIMNSDFQPDGGLLPESVKRMPLDITERVPAGSDVKLNFILTDHGKYWGNTDIYIIVR